MNQLETLLNTLIKMWWKPFGMEIHAEYIDRIVVEWPTMHIIFKWDWEYIEGLRSLVSLESWLWQFVCKNKLYKDNNDIYPHIDRIIEDNYYQDVVLEKEEYTISDHKYRLLESALIPEEELGKFLVENIAIGWKKE